MLFLLSSCGFGGGKVRVLNCKGYGQVAYNTKSGRLYGYDSFKESWQSKKLREYTSRSSSTGGANFSMSEEVKYESIFLNGNLKVKKETFFSSTLGLSSGSGTKVVTTVIYDAKKDKKNFKVKGYDNKIYTCKLDPQKKLVTPKFEIYNIKGGVN